MLKRLALLFACAAALASEAPYPNPAPVSREGVLALLRGGEQVDLAIGRVVGEGGRGEHHQQRGELRTRTESAGAADALERVEREG